MFLKNNNSNNRKIYMNYNKNNTSKNINLNETHEEQVMRVLHSMVAAGEITKTQVNGEDRFELSPTACAEERSRRSAIAKKAWATRKANTATKTTKAVCGKTKNNMQTTNRKCDVKAKVTTPAAKRSAAAHKAVATRRLNAKAKVRSIAAHKAVATRRLNAKAKVRSIAAHKAVATRKLRTQSK